MDLYDNKLSFNEQSQKVILDFVFLNKSPYQNSFFLPSSLLFWLSPLYGGGPHW